MALKMTVLGFAGAAPLAGACPAYLVADGETTVLLDCGPGALERLWQRGLLGRLDAIVISHMHADHILDLLMVAGELGSSMLKEPAPALHVPTGGTEVLAALDEVVSGGRKPSRFEQAFALSEYGPDERLRIGELELTFAATSHRGLCCAARVTDGRAALVYGADGAPSEAVERLAREVDLLILEATYATDAQAAAEQGHMTAAQAGELATRAGAKRLLVTHLLPGSEEAVLDLAKEAFDGPVALAREGLSYELSA